MKGYICGQVFLNKSIKLLYFIALLYKVDSDETLMAFNALFYQQKEMFYMKEKMDKFIIDFRVRASHKYTLLSFNEGAKYDYFYMCKLF